MKKSEVCGAQSELVEQSVGEQLEAPVRLTPEQLESVAAGFMAQISRGGIGSTATTGLFPAKPVFWLF